MKVLSSEWMGLSDHLLARFWAVDSDGNKQGDIEVRAPLTDSNLESVLNWQSPFEASGADSKAPAVMAMIQSGAIVPVLNALRDSKGRYAGLFEGEGLEGTLMELEGKTGLTKLNSTQVFSGMPPIKITVTATFRAYRDPVSEVSTPFNKLFEWSLPQKLAPDGVLVNVINTFKSSGNASEYLNALLPSESPQLVAFQYKGKTFKPMVIESISEPMNSPIDSNGVYTELEIPMILSTLTALDKNDWVSLNSSSEG